METMISRVCEQARKESVSVTQHTYLKSQGGKDADSSCYHQIMIHLGHSELLGRKVESRYLTLFSSHPRDHWPPSQKQSKEATDVVHKGQHPRVQSRRRLGGELGGADECFQNIFMGLNQKLQMLKGVGAQEWNEREVGMSVDPVRICHDLRLCKTVAHAANEVTA